MDNPSLRVNRYGCSTSRSFIVEDFLEDEFGQRATDEVTGEQDSVNDEGSFFFFLTWDNNEYAWQSRPLWSRKLKKNVNEMAKVDQEQPERALLSQEQAHESELLLEEDSAWWSNLKQGKKVRLLKR